MGVCRDLIYHNQWRRALERASSTFEIEYVLGHMLNVVPRPDLDGFGSRSQEDGNGTGNADGYGNGNATGDRERYLQGSTNMPQVPSFFSGNSYGDKEGNAVEMAGYTIRERLGVAVFNPRGLERLIITR